MKKSLLVAFLSLLTLAGWSLDPVRVHLWEQELSPYMRTDDKAQLLSSATALEAQRTQKADDYGTWAKLGITYHNLSRALQTQGIKGNAVKAADLFQGILKSSTDEELKMVALTYWGSSLTLQGNEDPNPIAKIAFVNQGLDKLRDSVSRYGQASWIPSLLRANVALALPDFFGQLDVGGSDLKALETMAEKSPQAVPVEIQAMTENLFGDYWKKKKKIDPAIAAWQRALALDPKKEGAGKAASRSLEIYAD